MRDEDLLRRITFNPDILGGKPIISGMRIAVEHVLGMLASGSTVPEILDGYPFLVMDDIQHYIIYEYRRIANEHVEPSLIG